MNTEEYVRHWSESMLQVISGMAEWRQQHPKVTFREIETELDGRWARARAGMLADLALCSTAADWSSGASREQPLCPNCGTQLKAEGGKKQRRIRTQGDQEVLLARRYGVCPSCRRGIFPPG